MMYFLQSQERSLEVNADENSIGTVSYTHLDVYKRQDTGRYTVDYL